MTETTTAAQEAWITSERVRKAAPDMLAALDSFPEIGDDTNNAYIRRIDVWWDQTALPAIEKAKGARS